MLAPKSHPCIYALQVVQGARTAKITLYNNQTFDAELKGSEPDKDLAVLKIVRRLPADFVPISVTSSSNLQVSDHCMSQHSSQPLAAYAGDFA